MADFPTIKPTIASNVTINARINKIQFGNGYYQSFGDGINNLLEKWSITFTVDNNDKKTIISFLNTQAGYNYFNWTAPDEGAVQKQYVCEGWTTTPLGNNMYTITCTFNEYPGLI